MSNRERAIEMRRATGASSNKIAAELGISRERVCQYLRPLGLAARITQAERFSDEIKTLEGTMPQCHIAAKLGIKTEVVSAVLGNAEPGEVDYFAAMELVGKVYPGSQLFVLSVDRHGRFRKCRVRCECGNEKTIIMYNLIGGRTRSCGCLVAENCFGHSKEKPMNLEDCQLLRARLVEKHNADLQALDRVEAMLLTNNQNDVPREFNGTVATNGVPAVTRGKLLKAKFDEALASLAVEFTTRELHDKVREMGSLTVRSNIMNRLNALILKGQIEVVGKSNSTQPPSNIYRKKEAAPCESTSP